MIAVSRFVPIFAVDVSIMGEAVPYTLSFTLNLNKLLAFKFIEISKVMF